MDQVFWPEPLNGRVCKKLYCSIVKRYQHNTLPWLKLELGRSSSLCRTRRKRWSNQLTLKLEPSELINGEFESVNLRTKRNNYISGLIRIQNQQSSELIYSLLLFINNIYTCHMCVKLECKLVFLYSFTASNYM